MTRRVALAFVLLSLAAVLVGGLWVAARAVTAARLVQGAQADLASARSAYERQDLEQGGRDVARARDRLVSARRATSDPVWLLAGTVPLVGDDVDAVRQVAASAAELVEAAEPVAAAAGRLSAEAGTGSEPGAVLAAVVVDPAVAPGLALTRDRADEAEALVARLSEQDLHPRVQEQVGAYGDQLVGLGGSLEQVVAYSGLLPVLLGLGEPTDLLVVVQTPAEVRSLGGLAGLVLSVRADGGSLTVHGSYAGSSVPVQDDPVLSTPELEAYYALLGDRVGRFMVNATMVPDGALAAELLNEAHVRTGGATPDAVVITDLTVLSRLLVVTGPVTLQDGTVLDAATSDALLQHGTYVDRPDPLAQDAFFAAAAVGVVDALSAPSTDAAGLARALLAESRQGRLVVWSPDPGTQQLVVDVGMAGDLLSDPASVGVFLNDGTGSKMQYFLRSEASVVVGDDGRGTVRLDLRSTAVPGAPLPAYVTGPTAALGMAPGTQRVQVMVQGAVGGGPSRWLVDGVPVLAGSGTVEDRGVGVHSVDVPAGGSVRVEVELADGQGLTAARLVTTPSVVVLPGTPGSPDG